MAMKSRLLAMKGYGDKEVEDGDEEDVRKSFAASTDLPRSVEKEISDRFGCQH